MPDRITEAELERVYDDTITELYAYISRRCASQRELAQDVAQETWFRALRDWRARGVPPNAIGWLKTVARNLIVSHYRKQTGIPLEHVAPAELLATVDANDLFETREIAQMVGHALSRIPSGEARLLETFHYDRVKVSQLAEQYGISERAVEGRLRRARERLRRELETTLRMHRGMA